MRALRLGAAAIGLYLIFLAATVPAGLAAWAVGKLGGPAIALERPEGSLWHGQAQALDISAPGGRYRLPAVAWRLRGWPLLTGQLAVAFEYGGEGRVSRGVVVLSRSQVRLEDMQASLPVPLLLQAFPAWRGYALQGEARLRGQAFALGPDRGEGELEIDWLGAASPLSPVNPLGDYRLRLAGDQQGVAANLATLHGPLRLEGSGHWSAREGLRFAGTAAAPDRAAALEPVLRTLGKERGGGVYVIAIEAGGAR